MCSRPRSPMPGIPHWALMRHVPRCCCVPYVAHLSTFPISTPFRQQGWQPRLSTRTNGDHCWPGPIRDLKGLPNWPPLVSPTVANITHSTRQEQRASRPTGPLRLGRGALVRYFGMGPLWSHVGPKLGPANLGVPPGSTAHHSKARPSKAHCTAPHGTAQHITSWGHSGPAFVST